tara:strand:- start:291 stop:599 length:309 start_codon:yes stop_codon:yes gene_type:complete
LSTGEHLDNHHDSDHPSAKQYVLVGIILTVITILEVGVYYVEALRSLFAVIFLGAGAIKFAFVAFYYMHLKMDHYLFSAFFFGGLVLAGSIAIALMAILGAF